MNNIMDKIKKAGKGVVDGGAKTMLKVTTTHASVGSHVCRRLSVAEPLLRERAMLCEDGT
jgi:hypothetical protein